MKIEGIDRTGVVGAGLMGHSIALSFAVGGYRVTMTDTTEQNLARAAVRVEDTLTELVDQGLVDAAKVSRVSARISTPTSLEAMADMDFVIEAVFEDLETRADNPGTIREMVGRGDLGVKSGRGFYDWDEAAVAALRKRITTGLTMIDGLRGGR